MALEHQEVDPAAAPEGSAVRRYLDLVKAVLLDEHYLENEYRLAYLADCIDRGVKADPRTFRDPAKFRSQDLDTLRSARRTGVSASASATPPMFPFTTVGRSGLDRLHRCLETIRDEALPGDLVVCGVGRGGAAIFMRAFLDAYELNGPRVWVVDSFRDSPEPRDDPAADSTLSPLGLVSDLNVVREGFARFGLLDERARFIQGSFADALADAPIGELALLWIGTETGQATTRVLDRLYDRVTAGGFTVVEHYDGPGCQRSVDAFRARRTIEEPIERIDWTGAWWRKSDGAEMSPVPALRERARAPLPPPAVATGTDLSVVVVFHDMRREAMRTLHSLSRPYQRGVEDVAYEVIVVENGSSPEQRLGEELVRSFGSEFRYLDLGPDSTPSPAHALNRGIEISRGDVLALMIDGAHVLSPGVLRFGMLGLRTYEPAVVTTHQWFVGPGQQSEAMDAGYDQAYEDRLFEEIAWPADGYRLFEIGSFIGDRDWFDNHWESNCLFVPRVLLEQSGGFDETFSMPGGGYANLDLFERLTTTPGVNVVDILGEASFHQLHGGTTTNRPDAQERYRRLADYRDNYEEVRRRQFRSSGKRRHFVGSMFQLAAHTKPRWRTGKAFRALQRVDARGFPSEPTPIPDELRAQYTDAYWHSLAWRQTAWLGWRTALAPADLFAYQDLVASVRPDWLLDTHAAIGGRAMFLASICELLGHGRVLAIRRRAAGRVPDHPRISYLIGDPFTPEMRAQVFETIGEQSTTVVALTAARRGAVIKLFETYSPLVPVGSYVVVEDTILHGHPVVPEFGPGPAEAVKDILRTRGDFAPDPRLERFGPTFNPGGFLKRVR